MRHDLLCVSYVAFVKDRGLEVLEWRDKGLIEDLHCMFKPFDTYVSNYNTCELSFSDLGSNLIFKINLGKPCQ